MKQEIKEAYFSVKMDDIIVRFNNNQCNLSDLIRTLLSSSTISSISIPLNDLTAFHASIQQRIAKISLFYGRKDWNTKVNSLIEQLKQSKQSTPFDERNPIHFFSVVMLAAMLSNPELYFPNALLNAWDSVYQRIFERLGGLGCEANNSEITFNLRNSSDSQQIYSIDLADFNVNVQNRLDRLMLADAILRIHNMRQIDINPVAPTHIPWI
jgi:hypothetical protein